MDGGESRALLDGRCRPYAILLAGERADLDVVARIAVHDRVGFHESGHPVPDQGSHQGFGLVLPVEGADQDDVVPVGDFWKSRPVVRFMP